MNPRIFLSKFPSSKEFQRVFLLLREALWRLFPQASPMPGAEEQMGNPYSFFLREGESLFWVEVVFNPLSREGLTHYLTQAKQVQTLFPAAKICGIFAAPDFEPEVPQLLEWILIPIRLFRYREVVSLENSHPETAFWIEEVCPSASKRTALPESVPSAESFEEPSSDGLKGH